MQCYCGVTDHDPEHADYVVDGVPCCGPSCARDATAEALAAGNRVSHVHSGHFHPGDDGDPHALEVA
jgi:hypothetical protein